MTSILRTIGASVLLVGICCAQQKETPRATTTVTDTSPTTQPINDQWNNQATALNLQQRADGGQRDYLGGYVIVDDASIPPFETVVKIICDGKERYQTKTDIQGNFYMQSYFDDVTGRPMNTSASFVGCDVTAVSPGFESDKLKIQEGTIRDSPNVGTLRLRRAGDRFHVLQRNKQRCSERRN